MHFLTSIFLQKSNSLLVNNNLFKTSTIFSRTQNQFKQSVIDQYKMNDYTKRTTTILLSSSSFFFASSSAFAVASGCALSIPYLNTNQIINIQYIQCFTAVRKHITIIIIHSKYFPQFWLAKSTPIIHHNQLLMTKLGRILCLTRNDVKNAAFYRLMHR